MLKTVNQLTNLIQKAWGAPFLHVDAKPYRRFRNFLSNDNMFSVIRSPDSYQLAINACCKDSNTLFTSQESESTLHRYENLNELCRSLLTIRIKLSPFKQTV